MYERDLPNPNLSLKPAVSNTDVRAAALEYAKRGWFVFPADSLGDKKSHKSAKYSNGKQWGKTLDPDEIRRDFDRWPNANIGIVTGKDSGIFVVEADTPKGHDVDGIASLKKLEATHGGLPATLTAESPTGSLHAYFRWPRQGIVRNSTSKIGPGISRRWRHGPSSAICQTWSWRVQVATQNHIAEAVVADEAGNHEQRRRRAVAKPPI